MTEKGICKKHGEFILTEGCPLCIAERQGIEGNTEESIAEAIKAANRDKKPLLSSILPAAEIALALRPGEDMEAHGYFEEALKLLEYAESRVIKTLDDNKSANDDLSLISKLKKLMDDKRKALLAPLKAQSDAIRETYDYLMAPVLEADKLTRGKMLAYDAEQRRIRAEQEEINRKRQEAAEQEMKLKGELSESVNLVEVIPEPAKSIGTEMGTTSVVDRWKYEVVDFALLPDAYKMADAAQLTAIAKRHHDQKSVPGVRFYNEPIIASRAR